MLAPARPLMVQPKLWVSGAEDSFEREADRVASAVVGAAGSQAEVASAAPANIVHRDAIAGGGGVAAPPAVESAIGAARSGGRSLPQTIGRPMGEAMGTDLSGVRVHTGSTADSLNSALDARAFTTGRDIFFGRGSYSPGTREGRRLIAHELAHVVQQSGGSAGQGAVQRAPASGVIQRCRLKRGQRPTSSLKSSKRDATKLRSERPKKSRKAKELQPDDRPLSRVTGFQFDGLDLTYTPPSRGTKKRERSEEVEDKRPLKRQREEPPVEEPELDISAMIPVESSLSPEYDDTPRLPWLSAPTPWLGAPTQLPWLSAPQPTSPWPSFSVLQPTPMFPSFSAPQTVPSFSFLSQPLLKRDRSVLAPAPSGGFDFVESWDFDSDEWVAPEEQTAPRSDGFDLDFDGTKQQRGQAASAYIEKLKDFLGDTQELASWFPWLTREYEMQWIKLVDIGTPRARVVFKINPSFEIALNGTDLEMRGEGTGTGSAGAAAKTRVAWTTGTLTLGTTKALVGLHMLANPLSADHMQGTGSQADTDQKWMKDLPSASGSNDDGYVKGHLLNDNLGGIANEKNLFPITGFANKQHLANAEQWIKKGVDNGYVYAYRVDIGNVTEGPIATTTQYWVDADLYFEFARLSATGTNVPGTYHKGTVKSRFKKREADPFTKGKVRKQEFSNDYKTGMVSKPQASKLGGKTPEQVSTDTQYLPGTSNKGMVDDRRTQKLVANQGFTYTAPVAFGTNPFPAKAAVTPQTINPAPTYAPKLSLKQSVQATVEAQFASIVTGWTATDITAWANEVRTDASIKTWAAVEAAAVKHKLDAKIAASIFAAGGEGRNKTSINGAP